LFLNSDSGLCRQLITQILTKLWEIQKWIQSQKAFHFYSSSILIVYDARKLRQVLETKKRVDSSTSSIASKEGSNGNVSPSSELAPPTVNRNSGTFGGSGEVLNMMGTSPPKNVYRKIQRSHSSMNNYEQVSLINAN